MGCSSLQHPFFWIDPDLTPGSVGFVTPRAQIESLQSGARITGMTVIQEDPDAWVYAFDDTNNRIRYWRSDLTPVAANGGSLTIPPDVDSTFDDVSGDIGTDGTHIYISCTNEEDPVGICKFLPNRANSTLDFVEVIDDPISNHTLAKGPRLGGIDFLTPTQIAASDKNGPILQYTMVGSVEAQGVELPREFTIVRIATSPPN
jgi:hypothetical protein